MSTDSSQAQRKPLGPHKPAPLPPVVGYEDVTVACGHVEKFGLFEDKRDKFRDLRRKKLQERPCKACREKRLQEEQTAAHNRKDQRPQRPVPPRLPDGARIDAAFNATRGEWVGTLTIGESVYRDTARALFTLMSKLDNRYRRSLPPTPAPTGATAP